MTLVPDDFDVPLPPPHPSFRFEILGPEHNEPDLAAWTSSMEHIHTSPGWEAATWPDRVYSLDENLADLTEHREHHLARIDFAWTVLDPADGTTVVGCVYLKPDPTGRAKAEGRSWVSAARAELDRPLRDHLAPWFADAWPLTIRYAA